MDTWFGEVYWRPTRELLRAEVTRAEAEFLAAALGLGPGVRVLDCASGHGRHGRALVELGRGPVVSLDNRLEDLRAGPAPGACAGDMRALPFAVESFGAVFSWYSSLFVYDDATHVRILAELARVLARRGRLAVHTANPLRLERAPDSHEVRTLSDGAVVEERGHFDGRVDHLERRIVLPDGRALEGRAAIRYYPPAEFAALARAAGLATERFCGGIDGAPFGDDSLDLIAILHRP